MKKFGDKPAIGCGALFLHRDFGKLDIRVGRIIQADEFPEARKPSYKLKIDFGKDIGIKKSCAQLVKNYKKDELVGRLVLAVYSSNDA